MLLAGDPLAGKRVSEWSQAEQDSGFPARSGGGKERAQGPRPAGRAAVRARGSHRRFPRMGKARVHGRGRGRRRLRVKPQG